MLWKIFCLLFLLIGFNLSSQELKFVSKLPSIINESSGVETSGENRIWSFNDSGGKSELYLLDTLGNLVKTLKIKAAWNRDWEDITKDDKGNFYIGNIGNNDNKSKDLSIFKIPNPETIPTNTVKATTIKFTFEDQSLFPPSKDRLNFDCEGMFWYNQHIYLFTKNRSYPSATNVYRIPSVQGEYIAHKIGTFFTGKDTGKRKNLYKHWVTGAAISPDNKKVCLVNGKKLWVFYDFKGDDFFGGKSLRIDLGDNTQKEAVCFINNNEVFITDEYWKKKDVGGNLYRIKLDLVNQN